MDYNNRKVKVIWKYDIKIERKYLGIKVKVKRWIKCIRKN